MAKVKITGHASGTGVVTITAPNTSTDRTITLPDGTGTLLDENSSLPAANLTGTVADARISALTASKLTGDLPAISGVNVTNVHAVNSGKKNWIINGDFSIWQRYGVAGAAQPNSGYVADRWKGNNYTSGTYTFAQRTDATGQTFTTYGRLHQSVAGSTNARQCLDQYIEGTYLVGKTITVSFKARANAALAGCQVRGIFTSVQTFNLTTDWVKYSFTATAISSGSTARLMVDYGFSNAVWYADIAEFQVEVGSVATDFEKRSYGEELALCQRFFYNPNYNLNGARSDFNINYLVSGGNSGWITWTVPFPVPMRVSSSFSHSLTNAKNVGSAAPGNGVDGWSFYIQNQGFVGVVGNGNISTLSGGGKYHGIVGTYYCSPSSNSCSHILIGNGCTFQFDAEL
jgi:hypothetical protein